ALKKLTQHNITELVSPEPRYAFSHIIIQQVTYDQLLFQQRRELHRRAAEWIERTYAADLRPVYAQLVHHFRNAENYGQTLEYLKLAGDEAARANACADAASLYREGLACLEAQPDRSGWAEQEMLFLTGLGTALGTLRGFGHPEVEAT